MKIILLLLLLAILFIGKRLYTIYRTFSESNGEQRIRIQLSWKFYVEEFITLLGICIFLIALDPVPAIYAIAAVFGIFIDLFVSIYYYSIRGQFNARKETVIS